MRADRYTAAKKTQDNCPLYLRFVGQFVLNSNKASGHLYHQNVTWSVARFKPLYGKIPLAS